MIPQALSVVLTGAFVAGVLLLCVARRERARRGLARLARRRHLAYRPTDIQGLRYRFRGLELLRLGYHRSLTDVVSGSTPLGPAYVFRYRYERGFGVARRAYRWTVAVMELEHPAGEWSRLATLGFPATFECRGWLISLQTEDAGREAVYERLLDAVQQAAREVLSAAEKSKSRKLVAGSQRLIAES